MFPNWQLKSKIEVAVEMKTKMKATSALKIAMGKVNGIEFNRICREISKWNAIGDGGIIWNTICQVHSTMIGNRSFSCHQICASSFKWNEINNAGNFAMLGMKYAMEASKEMKNMM